MQFKDFKNVSSSPSKSYLYLDMNKYVLYTDKSIYYLQQAEEKNPKCLEFANEMKYLKDASL